MLSAIMFGGVLARVRQAVSGPAATAIGVCVVVIGLAGALALGIAWLRGDAARDAAAAAQAVCEADKLQAALDAERRRADALRVALAERDATISHLAEQRRLDDAMLTELETERAHAIETARKWEDAAGRRGGVVFRADDPWLRKSGSATDAARGGAAGR